MVLIDGDGSARGACAVPVKADCANKNCNGVDHSIWCYRTSIEKFRRAAGLPQGGTHNCAMWNAFVDTMTDMQNGMAEEK